MSVLARIFTVTENVALCTLSGSAANLIRAMQAPVEPSRVIKLEPEQELRIEIDHKQLLKISLVNGKAEVFGSELASNAEYTFQGRKLAIFSWQGCTLKLTGTASVEYVAGDTPMHTFLNAHMALQHLREQAGDHDVDGPRVMVVGSSDVGKTSLCKILLNYTGSKPLYVDIDTNEGSVTVPGSLTAMSMTRAIDPEEDLSATPISTNTTPVTFYYGYANPLEKAKFYSILVSQLAATIQRKIEIDPQSKHAGMIVNTPNQFVEGTNGLDLLKQSINALKISTIFVIGNERLFSDLKRTSDPKISILKLSKSGGVVNRDASFRRATQMQKIREYFYGTQHTQLGRADLNPYSLIVPYIDVQVRKVGQDLIAPSSALPIGADINPDETKMVKIEVGNILLHSVVAVSNVVCDDGEGESELVLNSSVAGFIYISAIDDVKQKMTILSPAAGKLPKKFLIMAALKWVES